MSSAKITRDISNQMYRQIMRVVLLCHGNSKDLANIKRSYESTCNIACFTHFYHLMLIPSRFSDKLNALYKSTLSTIYGCIYGLSYELLNVLELWYPSAQCMLALKNCLGYALHIRIFDENEMLYYKLFKCNYENPKINISKHYVRSSGNILREIVRCKILNISDAHRMVSNLEAVRKYYMTFAKSIIEFTKYNTRDRSIANLIDIHNSVSKAEYSIIMVQYILKSLEPIWNRIFAKQRYLIKYSNNVR